MYIYAQLHIQYRFNHCVVSVCIQVCTTNREGGAGGEKLPAGGGGGSRDPVLGSRGVGTEK
jgi:hypothetical protein